MKLINQPELLPNAQRMMAKISMLIGSAAVGYFLKPLLTAILWIFGGKYGYSHLMGINYEGQTIEMLQKIIILAAFSVFVLISWAQYNKVVFGRLNRRKNPLPVSIEELAQLYNINNANVVESRQAKSVVLEVQQGMPVYSQLS